MLALLAGLFISRHLIWGWLIYSARHLEGSLGCVPASLLHLAPTGDALSNGLGGMVPCPLPQVSVPSGSEQQMTPQAIGGLD